MLCSQCQQENPNEAKFCLHCGTRLVQVCPQCQQVLPPEAKFCMACGHALTVTSTSDSQGTQLPTLGSPPVNLHTPEAERRQLTVMFCDLVGSTALSGQLDPEDLRDVIRAYQEAAADVIQRYDGHIAQHLGDGMLVYFGYPIAHEDDAQRAVHTGLGVVEAIGACNVDLTTDYGVELAVRVGIHTGPVVVGDMGGGGRHEQLAMGETPNIAARLQGLAAPNTLLISEATSRLVQGFFDTEPLGEHVLKGVADALRIYRALRPSGVQHRLDGIRPGSLTPLVGRDLEVNLLRERWHQALAGRGQVVILQGDAGIGKSRLVHSLKAHLIAVPHTRVECRSLPYYHHTALYPVIDLLQRLLDWQPDETSDERLTKLEQMLSRSRLSLEESVPLLAGLLSLPWPEPRYPPLKFTPQRQRDKTLETLVTLILERAERETVLFILEDLHWTDPSTLELLDLLVEQTPTAALYVVLTCRPEFEARWGSKSYVTEVTLSRLSRDEIEQMVSKMTGEKPLPDEVLKHLVDKTDGVPLYVEEMTKAVLESGMVKEQAEQYALTGPRANLSVPATLQDSLMARLDRLGTAKAVAQYGSVIGREFSYALLQAVSELDDTTLRRELGRLVEAELVYQRGVLPQSTYLFKHALVQETAYKSLLNRTRQSYHQRIAHILETQFPEVVETQPEMVAHHYTEAGLAEPAIGYWQRAGQQASERSAYQETMNHLTSGLDLLQTLPETLARHQQELPLQMALGTASLIARGHTAPEVEAAYTRARLLCRQLGDTQDVFPVLFGLFRFYLMRSDLALTRQLGEGLLALAERQDEAPLYVMAHYALGVTCLFLGELLAAHRHLEAGIARDTPSQPRSPLFWAAGHDPGVACRAFSACMLWGLGYPDQALARTHETLALATKIDHPFSTAFALLLASMVSQLRREEQEVYHYADVGVTLSTEQRFPLWLAGSTIPRGWALTVQGQKEEGVRQMRQGLTNWRAAGAELCVPPFLTLLAEGYGALEQTRAGLDILKEGLAVMERTGEYWWQAEVYRLQGELRLKQAPPDEAEAEGRFHQALAVARQQQAKSLELRAATSLARLWQSQDKRQDAYDLLVPVYGWFTEGFDTADLKDAKALLSELKA